MSLNELSRFIKKVFRGGVALLVVYFLLRVFFIPTGVKLWKTVFPPKDAPNPVFGQIDPPHFVKANIREGNYKYVLNTQDGRLPSGLPKKMDVFTYKDPVFSFSAKKDATERAETLGFDDTNITSSIKSTIYTWEKLETESELTIDTETELMEMNTILTGKSFFYPPRRLTESEAISRAKGLLRNLEMWDDEQYLKGNQTALLGEFTSTGIMETDITSNVQIAKVDFYRTARDYPVLGPDPRKGLISIFVGNYGGTHKILNYPILYVNIREIDPSYNASYPIISVQTAWSEIQKGNGVISNATPTGFIHSERNSTVSIDNILIEDIYLAYYENTEPHKYLQPIYVFEGYYQAAASKGDVFIYYPAVSGEYIKTQGEETESDDVIKVGF